MKQEPHDKYCDATFGRGNYTTWLGIRMDEPARLTHFSAIEDMFTETAQQVRPIRYLAEISEYGKPQILSWWKKQPFDLQLEEHKGNCVFCIKKGEVKLWHAAAEEPEMAEEFRQVLMSPTVRIKPTDKYGQGILYRGQMGMGEIIRMSRVLGDEQSLKNMLQTIREEAMFAETDPTLCSESCEIFTDQQFDFHEELKAS